MHCLPFTFTLSFELVLNDLPKAIRDTYYFMLFTNKKNSYLFFGLPFYKNHVKIRNLHGIL